MTTQLSVIVPLYNAGAYFDAFMQSLLAQRFRAMEIIVVDDGSTDGSGERAEFWASQADNIRVLHQPNGGVSCARNAGLRLATGQYVAFPDADDILSPALYSTLMAMVQDDDLDAAQCNALRFSSLSEPGKTLIPTDRLRSTAVMSGSRWLGRALQTRRYLHVVWLGVYRRALIQQLGLDFVPGLHHQDIPWTTEFMLNARRVRYTEQTLYHYRMHAQSISNRPREGTATVRYQRHYLKICRLLEEINQRYRHAMRIPSALHQQITREALGVCHAIRRESDPAIRQMMIADIWRSNTHCLMLRNARGIHQWYQLLLWLTRLLLWRNPRQVK